MGICLVSERLAIKDVAIKTSFFNICAMPYHIYWIFESMQKTDYRKRMDRERQKGETEDFILLYFLCADIKCFGRLNCF